MTHNIPWIRRYLMLVIVPIIIVAVAIVSWDVTHMPCNNQPLNGLSTREITVKLLREELHHHCQVEMHNK
jgi:hypothetical protein